VKGPVVLADGLRFPEGPAFAPDGSLWGVEHQGGGLFRLDASGVLARVATGGAPNGLAFDAAGRPWFCDADRGQIRRLDADGATTVMADAGDGRPLDRPNDLAFDPAGTLVFTCPGNSRTEPTGTLWARAPNGTVQRVAGDLLFPNGLAFSPDGRGLVVAETYRHRLWRGGWDAALRRWIDPEPWVEVGGPTGPDGVAFLADGTLAVAVFGRSRIVTIAPDGKIADTIAVPGERPTNVAFDPSARHGLVVTEAERGRLLSFPDVGPGAALFTG
jgi:gluconolactonase